MPTDIKLRPFFGFYGGKWRDTPRHYPPPEHDTIVEPFAGSAGYAMRFPSRRVVLCDKDPVIAGLWRYLISVSSHEVLSIPDVPDGGTVHDMNLTQEQEWLVGFWLNRGVVHPRRSPSKWMREKLRPGSFWGERVRNTIAGQVDHIRHWRVHECSYEECPVNDDATWFVDPPYQRAGSHYRHGSKDIDYQHLSEWCRSLSGQVIVCENGGADWLPFSPIASVKTTRRGARSREVMWLGQPSA